MHPAAFALSPVPPQPPGRPTVFNGATVHGLRGTGYLRHRCELPLLWVSVVLMVVGYAAWVATLAWLIAVPAPSGEAAALRTFFLLGPGYQFLLVLPLLPFILWAARALLYARMRAAGVQMTPTQFPEGYRMVVEAAQRFGLRRVPDAYVVAGNGQINAFASGHGFRRFVAINSDLFEVGGSTRDPEALRFVISHEVGHIAAGHVSFWRGVATNLIMSVPLLGPALSRAQEYTADNHGYDAAPRGAAGLIGLLAGGKYLGAQVNLHAMADRASWEGGLWLHLVVWQASHPVLTWRAHALRDRRRPGRIMIKPSPTTAWFPRFHPTGSQGSATWPCPAQVLEAMDGLEPRYASGAAEEQFGRYPGVGYSVPRDEIRLADPTPVPRYPTPQLPTPPHVSPQNIAPSHGAATGSEPPYGSVPGS
ncbi:MAG: M48 family metallopeptidase [Actinomyces sp.]|uniref:M48 family metallopeptidase n=1 Tax=Actinomyces sp. TaxID=29317 RepID=UPI0026DC8A60|nr:M48 family metallopeptidase [Actinomyces sp.]MDO4243259.1 M48 family metallopeptidase [Actinomyces sp.]